MANKLEFATNGGDQSIKESEGVSPRWNNLQPAAASLCFRSSRKQSVSSSHRLSMFYDSKPCASASPAPSHHYYLHSLCLLCEREEGRGCRERNKAELQEWRTKRNQVKPPTALRMKKKRPNKTKTKVNLLLLFHFRENFYPRIYLIILPCVGTLAITPVFPLSD